MREASASWSMSHVNEVWPSPTTKSWQYFMKGINRGGLKCWRFPRMIFIKRRKRTRKFWTTSRRTSRRCTSLFFQEPHCLQMWSFSCARATPAQVWNGICKLWQIRVYVYLPLIIDSIHFPFAFLNSHKYLVNGQGHAIKSYGHRIPPMEIEEDIVSLLEENERQNLQLPISA